MNLNRLFSILTMVAFSFVAVFTTSCDEDDPVDPLVGVYALTSATSGAAFSVSLDGVNVSDFPASQDVTVLISGGLYISSPCANPVNARTELRSDGGLYNVCAGESVEAVQGSWEVNTARTELTLTVTIGTQSVPVILTGLTENGLTISGTITNFPFALDLTRVTDTAPLGATLTAGPYSGNPNIQFLNVTVTFTKVSI